MTEITHEALEALSKAVEQSGPLTASALVDLLGGDRRETQRLVQAAIDRGVLTVGAGLKVERRTGQLIHAVPSGDVVEAVARALYEEDDPWCKAWPWPNLQPDQGSPDAYRRLATAAITAYEAVSGVAKMRDALEKADIALLGAEMLLQNKSINATGALADTNWQPGREHIEGMQRTINQALAEIAAARAALGEQP